MAVWPNKTGQIETNKTTNCVLNRNDIETLAHVSQENTLRIRRLHYDWHINLLSLW